MRHVWLACYSPLSLTEADVLPDRVTERTPNKALDRTAMSAGLSVIAESWPTAALMAVGQLGR